MVPHESKTNGREEGTRRVSVQEVQDLGPPDGQGDEIEQVRREESDVTQISPDSESSGGYLLSPNLNLSS